MFLLQEIGCQADKTGHFSDVEKGDKTARQRRLYSIIKACMGLISPKIIIFARGNAKNAIRHKHNDRFHATTAAIRAAL